MRVLILTLGSRGDVQPYVALGRGLQDAGHVVRLATAEPFADFVTSNGLAFAPLTGQFLEILQTKEGKAAITGKRNSLKLMRQVKPILRQMLDDAWRAAYDVDLVIYHPKALAGYTIAEKFGIPGVLAIPAPLYSPTKAFASPLSSFDNLGGTLNRLSHQLTIWLASVSMRGLLNRWRKDALGMAPVVNELVLNGRPVLRLYPYSPTVIPMPADWDDSSVATGYWFLDQQSGWQPDPALLAFLEAGPAPVYVGFGSMPAEDGARKSQIVLEALSRSGQRGVLALGWGGLAAVDIPDHVHVLDAAPHDWLFPRMAAVVHHGGAGTTAAGLRAGAPTVICPFFGDQPFWGRRVASLGVGPDPIPQKKLATDALATAIAAATGEPAIRAHAAALGATIRAEDGIRRAIDVIETYVRPWPNTRQAVARFSPATLTLD